jgi:hypothetical protein
VNSLESRTKEVHVDFKTRRILIGALLCVCALVLPTAKSAPEEVIWFSVGVLTNGQVSIDPIGRVVEHNLVDIPDACAENNSEYLSFASRYMKPGDSYDVLFGGVPAGRVSLKKNDDPYYSLTPVEYTGSAQPHGRVQALATSAIPSTSRLRARQALNEEEKNLALELARTLFQRAGVSKSLLGRMKVENLTRTIVAPAELSTIIGSFTVPAGDFDSSVHLTISFSLPPTNPAA